jgi:hypothetical protein
VRHKIASLDQLDKLRRATKDGLTIRPVLSDYIRTDGTHEEQPDQHINNDGTITFTFRFTTGLVRGERHR